VKGLRGGLLRGRGVNLKPTLGHTRLVCRGRGVAQGGGDRGVFGVVERGGGRFHGVIRGVGNNAGEGAFVGCGHVHFSFL